MTTVAFVLKYSSPMYSIGTIGLLGVHGRRGNGEKRGRKRRKRRWKQANTVGERMLVCLYVEQLPLCWHSITSLKNVNNQHDVNIGR